MSRPPSPWKPCDAQRSCSAYCSLKAPVSCMVSRSATRYRGRQRELKQTVQQQVESLENQMRQMRVEQVWSPCSVLRATLPPYFIDLSRPIKSLSWPGSSLYTYPLQTFSLVQLGCLYHAAEMISNSVGAGPGGARGAQQAAHSGGFLPGPPAASCRSGRRTCLRARLLQRMQGWLEGGPCSAG